MSAAAPRAHESARSHEELIVWRLSYELNLAVDELIKTTPIRGDRNLHDQLRNAASAAPRLVAEGFGRYLPGEFSRYLRNANGELKETLSSPRRRRSRLREAGSNRTVAAAIKTRFEGRERSHRTSANGYAPE